MKDIAFLLYDSRSGSTLLSSLLNQFSGVSVSHESGFVSSIIEYNKALNYPSDIDSLFDELEREVQFQELRLDCDSIKSCFLENEFPISKQFIISTILEIYFAKRDPDAVCWVFKGPRLYFHVHRILRLFPNAKFIHLLRDGRAVFNSKKTARSVHGRFTENNLLKAASDWKKKINLVRSIQDHYFEIQFENLVDDSETTLHRLLDYLNISAEYRIITKKQTEFASRIGESQKHLHENVSSPPQRSIVNRWRISLPKSEILLYELIVGNCLKSKGYEVVFAGSKTSVRIKYLALIKAVYYTIHYVYKLVSNVLWSIFVNRSFIKKCRAKIYEFRPK